MSDLLSFNPVQVFGSGGVVAPGALAYFYDSGTTTARTVYSDAGLTTQHASPLVADANGVFPQAFVGGAAVKAVIKTAAGVTLYTLDPVVKSSASGAAASSVSFSPTASLPQTNVQDAIEAAAASAASGFTPYGLGVTGSAALLANIDASNIASGAYRFDATTTGTFPTGVAASDTGVIETWREVAGTAVMFLYVGDIGDKFFYRRYTSSAWTAWREVLNANQGAVDGDILVRVSGAWTRLAKGSALQALRMNAGATAQEWADITGLTLLGTITTTSGTSQSLSSLTLTGYKRLLFVANGVSHLNASNQTFSVGGAACSSALSSAAVVYGDVIVDLTTGRAWGGWAIDGSNGGSFWNNGNTGYSTATTSVSVGVSGASFDAGSVQVYGVK